MLKPFLTLCAGGDTRGSRAINDLFDGDLSDPGGGSQVTRVVVDGASHTDLAEMAIETLLLGVVGTTLAGAAAGALLRLVATGLSSLRPSSLARAWRAFSSVGPTPPVEPARDAGPWGSPASTSVGPDQLSERSSPMTPSLPTFADVQAAAERLRGQARVTPLLTGTPLDRICGKRVALKVEALQLTGSFKFRGAYNRLVQLTADQRRAGVVAFSSGNHAQGVAAAAQRLGLSATIVMPSDAPAIKLDNTRGYGAEVVTYDRRTGSREAIAADLADTRGAVLVPAFDDPHIIAGQGTVGLELARQAQEAGLELDTAYVCVGGGGLIAGSVLAIEALSPRTRVFAIEPDGFDDTARSLAAGERVANAPGARSFCDALLSPEPGELTFAINRPRLAGAVAVSDAEVAHAMAVAFRELKVVLEPGGAVALAALLAGKTEGETVAIVCSGGNVEPDLFAGVLT